MTTKVEKVPTRDFIRNYADIKFVDVTVPEWDDLKIKVKTLTVRQRSRLFQNNKTFDGQPDMEKIYPELAVMVCYELDEKTPIFVPDDVLWLAEKSSSAVERIAQVAFQTSGMNQTAVDDAKKP
jgi:hypothetical protein